MQEIYQAIIDAQEKHEDLVLATIIENVGSSPRTTGTKMLVRKDLSIVGTIGGGRLEADSIQKAGEIFNTRKDQLFHFALNGKDAAAMDMICGGYGDVLLTFISGNQPVIAETFKKVLASTLEHKKGWLLTKMDLADTSGDSFCFIDENGEKTGALMLQNQSLQDLAGNLNQISIHSDSLQKAQVLIEPIQKKKKLIIFGGGHVSKATTQLANTVEFRTIVLDDRTEYANAERFPDSEIIVVPDYESLPELNIDEQTFIVIMTRGHLGDYDVLRQTIQSKACYIGMIGSRHKRELIYERLRNEGISQAEIDRVTSPIGLPINGETPEEIAVSVVAQLILERSRLK